MECEGQVMVGTNDRARITEEGGKGRDSSVEFVMLLDPQGMSSPAIMSLTALSGPEKMLRTFVL